MTKKYWIRLIIGSILFGVFTFGSEVYNKGAWDWSEMWLVIYGIITFGVLFHVLFSLFINRYNKKKKSKQ